MADKSRRASVAGSLSSYSLLFSLQMSFDTFRSTLHPLCGELRYLPIFIFALRERRRMADPIKITAVFCPSRIISRSDTENDSVNTHINSSPPTFDSKTSILLYNVVAEKITRNAVAPPITDIITDSRQQCWDKALIVTKIQCEYTKKLTITNYSSLNYE